MENFNFGEFQIVTDDIFENFSKITPNQAVDESSEKYNYCNDCNIAMCNAGTEYQCPNCGIIKQLVGDAPNANLDDMNGASNLRISVGGRGRFYNINNDYTRAQRAMILQQLTNNNTNYSGSKFQKDILTKAANLYNDIQKMIIVDGSDDAVGKKFVKRGNIKDETLAAIVYYECRRAGVTRKKKDVASFMKLPSNGFSRGEDIIRSLSAESKIDIPIDDDPTEDFIERYLEGLNMDNEEYSGFISELVSRSEKHRVGMNSQISSKVAGAIWMLCDKKKINGITIADIERACDSCKKNTFQRFCKAVEEKMPLFSDIFDKYEIPHNCKIKRK
jgi:hypothetical protein